MNPLAWMQLTISLPLAVKFDIIGVVVVINIAKGTTDPRVEFISQDHKS